MARGPRSGESSRRLLVGSAGLFLVSSSFPVAASLIQVGRLPRWVGVADVVVAAILIVVGMVLVVRKPSDFGAPVLALSFKAYRGFANVFLALLAMFFVVGDSINWSILLPGLAWRGWLLVWGLPSWLSLSQAAHPSVEV